MPTTGYRDIPHRALSRPRRPHNAVLVSVPTIGKDMEDERNAYRLVDVTGMHGERYRSSKLRWGGIVTPSLSLCTQGVAY